MKKIFYVLFILFLSTTLIACKSTDAQSLSLDESQSLTLTLDELSVYTGANGSTAYIAVDGVIYDVTQVFSNGTHQGMQLGGKDVTAIFQSSPHTMAMLNSLPVVGTLVTSTTQTDTTTGATTGQTTTSTETSYLPVFTLEQLSQYTGANGSTAYIAVNGVIYDVTQAFSNGTHQGMQLGGTDATTVFASSPHSQSFLNQLSKVGSLEGFPLIAIAQTAQPPVSTNENEYEDEYEDDDVYYGTLPQAILDYLEANYPNISIREFEMEDHYYEVELSNHMELKFTLTGSFISSEWDD